MDMEQYPPIYMQFIRSNIYIEYYPLAFKQPMEASVAT